jgi:hypothetical protein
MTYGDSFFDGPSMQAAKGPLIGGGLTQLGKILVKKFVPSQAKYAPLIGTVLGAGVGAFLMTKPQHKEAGAAAVATALIIGIPDQLNQMMGGTLMGPEELGAITSEMGEGEDLGDFGANTLELLGDEAVQIEDSGVGSTALGAITSEMGAGPEDIQIQGSGSNFGRF